MISEEIIIESFKTCKISTDLNEFDSNLDIGDIDNENNVDGDEDNTNDDVDDDEYNIDDVDGDEE